MIPKLCHFILSTTQNDLREKTGALGLRRTGTNDPECLLLRIHSGLSVNAGGYDGSGPLPCLAGIRQTCRGKDRFVFPKDGVLFQPPASGG